MDYKSQYLTIRSLANNNTITLTKYQDVTTSDATYIEYSLDSGTTWTRVNVVNGTQQTLFNQTLAQNATVMFRGQANRWGRGDNPNSAVTTFSSSAIFSVEGNVLSLLYPSTFASVTDISANSAQFAWLFGNCTHLTDASNLELPALKLGTHCYHSMFRECTDLVNGPKVLPATTLAADCYALMFRGDLKLVETPKIMATAAANSCGFNMFLNCSALTKATCLYESGINTLGNGSTNNWMLNVPATGTFYKSQNAQVSTTSSGSGNVWPRSSYGIPSGWTVEDYSPIAFDVQPDTIDSDYTGGTFTVELTSDLQWAVAIPVEWFTVSPESGLTSSTLTITVAPNYGNARTATLLISDEDADEIEITISQDKYPVIIPFNNIYRGGNRLN